MVAVINKSDNLTESTRYLKKENDPKKSLLIWDSLGEVSTKERKAITDHVIRLNKNPKVKKRFMNISISFSPEEAIDDHKAILIARAYMTRMQFDNVPYQIYRHFDRDHPHIHVLATRITYDGKIVNEKNSYWRSMKVCTDLEVKFNLKTVNRTRAEKKLNNKIVHAEMHNYDSELEIRKLWSQLDTCKKKSVNLSEYINEAKKLGITVKIFYQNERPFGISYSRDLEKPIKSAKKNDDESRFGDRFIVRGQKLGRGYMISSLNQTFSENQNTKSSIKMETEGLKERVSVMIMESSSIPKLMLSLSHSNISVSHENPKNPVFIQNNQSVEVSQLDKQIQIHLDLLIQLNFQEARKQKEEKIKKQKEQWLKENFNQQSPLPDQNNSKSKGFKM